MREIEEKLRERKTLAPPPSVAPPSPPPNSTRIGRRVLRLPEVCEKTALCRSSIYQGMKEGWFPKAIKLSQRATGWNEHEIDAYLDVRTEASGGVKRSSRSGSFYVEPPDDPHFAQTRDVPVTMQISGFGPTGTEYEK